MANEELLLGISELFDKKIGPLENRMDIMETTLFDKIERVEQRLEAKIDGVEQRLEAKIDGVEQRLEAKIDGVEQRLGARIDNLDVRVDSLDGKIDGVEQSLRAEIHQINLKLENDFGPRLQNIEQCYLDTYRRYEYGVDKIEKLEADNELIRSVLMNHIQSHSA